MKRILVTGGAGYIGSITSRLLAEKGFTPIIFDNFSNGNEWAVKDFEIIKGDLRNMSEISSAINSSKPDGVIHFAALKAAGESMKVPEDFYENNVGGSANLCKAMIDHGTRKLVFSSTCAVYGTPSVDGVYEDVPFHPESAYGHSKVMVEEMLSWLAQLNRIDSVRLRYFNVAGAMPDGSLGEAGKEVLNIVPILMEVASGKRDSFTINGSDFNTPDGTCVRDYIHVVDLAHAHIAALKKLLNFPGTQYYNVGEGVGYSNLDVVHVVKTVTGVDFPVVMGPRRVGDPESVFADITKIKKELLWTPQYSLKDIVEHAWKWEKGGKADIVTL